MSQKHPDDGKFVVVQGGQRISDLQPSEQQALQEAARLRQVNEQRQSAPANGTESAPIQVKQNLYG